MSDLARLDQLVLEALIVCRMVIDYVKAPSLRIKRTERVNTITTNYIVLISHAFDNPHDDEADPTEYVLPQ